MVEQDRRGEKHWNWQGGKTSENQADRTTAPMLEWKRLVHERDLFHCRMCGKNDDTLHAHHIEPYAAVPEKRTDVANGLTLCANCHTLIHRYFREVQKNDS